MSLYRSIAAVTLSIPIGLAPALEAQTRWQTVEPSTGGTTTINSWESVPTTGGPTNAQTWEPLSPAEEILESEQLVWTEPAKNQNASPESDAIEVSDKSSQDDKSNQKESVEEGFRWPNGHLMSDADQIYYRTAYSLGSMIQIGETVYPNLGFNALQRHPDSWFSGAFVAIDDSRIGSSECKTGDFLDECADALIESRISLWNSTALSFDLHWTMHSLSGEGSPFNFTIGDQNFGNDDSGTKFGEGQSVGFVLSKNFGKTFGMTLAGYRLFHFDETTDLPRNFALFGTKVFRLADTLEPPIISFSLGIMTDVFNDETNIGTIDYPKNLRGGLYPSQFAAEFDKGFKNSYSPDTAGVSSAFVCADKSTFAGKPVSSANKECLQQVYLGPIASVGFAPWPWLGIYAKYSGTDIDLGVSLKPFKQLPWTISIEAVNPIKGVNPDLDASFDFKECRGKDNSTFSDCRTRVGIYTELAF